MDKELYKYYLGFLNQDGNITHLTRNRGRLSISAEEAAVKLGRTLSSVKNRHFRIK